ncbi:MAG: hypothetical protein SGI74_12375 [Oligoflexia bacterium]|nr:hypothetical protein [Oligoflexia bacterium]
MFNCGPDFAKLRNPMNFCHYLSGVRAYASTLLISMVSLTGLTNCAPQNLGTPLTNSHGYSHQPSFALSLVDEAKKIEHAGTQDDLCETKNKETRNFLTHVIMQKSEEISLFMKTYVPKHYTKKTFGPTSLLVPNKFPEHEKSSWQEVPDSWKDAKNKYDQIKLKPIDADWISLNSIVRSLIQDDHGRLVDK